MRFEEPFNIDRFISDLLTLRKHPGKNVSINLNIGLVKMSLHVK